jgi:hypothetical protein
MTGGTLLILSGHLKNSIVKKAAGEAAFFILVFYKYDPYHIEQ